MNRITEVQILERFTSNINGDIHGIYFARFNGKNKLFVENGKTIAVISHFLDKSADKCLNLIRDDVASELREAIIKITG